MNRTPCMNEQLPEEFCRAAARGAGRSRVTCQPSKHTRRRKDGTPARCDAVVLSGPDAAVRKLPKVVKTNWLCPYR
eukprot:gene6745-2011_t